VRGLLLAGALTIAAAASGCTLPATPPAAGAKAAPVKAAGPRVVYVEDHTGPAWPVDKATAQWRRAVKGVDIRYGKCAKGAGCVKVRACTEAEMAASADGDSMAVGRTTPKPGYQDVCLGTGPDDTYEVDLGLAIACHEIGHGLGLDHNQDKDSCMQAYIDSAPSHPGKRDIARLDGTV
jgi:hypothetical protein